MKLYVLCLHGLAVQYRYFDSFGPPKRSGDAGFCPQMAEFLDAKMLLKLSSFAPSPRWRRCSPAVDIARKTIKRRHQISNKENTSSFALTRNLLRSANTAMCNYNGVLR